MVEKPEFTHAVTCPVCAVVIPILKIELRFIGRYTCPHCGQDVVIEEKPQA